jgi:hypothetical protein
MYFWLSDKKESVIFIIFRGKFFVSGPFDIDTGDEKFSPKYDKYNDSTYYKFNYLK